MNAVLLDWRPKPTAHVCVATRKGGLSNIAYRAWEFIAEDARDKSKTATKPKQRQNQNGDTTKRRQIIQLDFSPKRCVDLYPESRASIGGGRGGRSPCIYIGLHHVFYIIITLFIY